MASTQHALRTSRASLRSAKQPRTQFANFPKYKYKVPEVQVSWNTSFLWTSTYKNALQASEVLQPYIKANEGISRTSLHHGVLTRFGDFFSYDLLNSRKWRIHTDDLRTRATFHVSSTKNSFFWFRSSGVHKQPVSFEVLAPPSLFIRGSHVQRHYWKQTTLRSKSSTIKDYFTHLNLTIARKGRWVISADYPASHPRRFCAVGDEVTRRYDVLHDWLWDACHMAGVRSRSRCKGFRSEEGPALLPWAKHEEAVIRQATINLSVICDQSNRRSQQKPLAKGGKGKIHR